jgi:hypothetical protein
MPGCAWRCARLAVGGAPQQAQRVRRIGVLIYGGEDSSGSQAQVAARRDGLKELGWVEDRNLRVLNSTTPPPPTRGEPTKVIE